MEKGFTRIELFKKALLKVGKVFTNHNIDYVLIGSLVIPLVYKIPWDVHDIDLYILNKSVLTESEFFEEIAHENDWDIGTTMHGLIYYEVLVNGDVIRVDLMENILDIYIPEEMIRKCIKVKVNDIEIKCIRLEDLLLLKAREASEESEEYLSKIAEILADPKYNISIDKNYVLKVIDYFPEEERNSIIRRIEKCGIYLE